MSQLFKPHSPQQEQAIFFTTPIGVLACGIQFGKTKAGSIWMKIQNHKFTDPTDNFLVIAPTYKILTQSTLPPYLDAMRGYGDFSKSDMVLRIHGGGTVYMRSGTDADSVVGITNVRAVWGDEAGLFTLYFSENLAARAAFRGAQTLYTTSPYTLNWLYKQIILPKMKNPSARPDVTLVQAASWDNPFFPKESIERNRANMDQRRFNAMFGGQWERLSGLVYDCFDEVENQCDPFALPAGTKYVGGIDWGFTQAFVFKVRAITPTGYHFGVHEFYKTGLTINDMVAAVKRINLIYGVGAVYCGPDQPGSIEEMNRNGIRAIAADNDVRMGIGRHYELLKTRRLKYFKGMNPYTLDEIEGYHYPSPEDLKPDQNEKDENPVKQQDHCCDTDRYISIMTYQHENKRTPFVPAEQGVLSEDPFKRIEQLKRRPKVSREENWS